MKKEKYNGQKSLGKPVFHAPFFQTDLVRIPLLITKQLYWYFQKFQLNEKCIDTYIFERKTIPCISEAD